MKFLLKIFALGMLLIPSTPCFALDSNPNIHVTPLLKTTHSWDNQPLTYPDDTAQITGLLIEIAPNAETGWHEHSVPSFGMVLEGILEITHENGQTKRLQAGEGFAEVVNTKHNGKNIGQKPLKLVVFYAGNTDLPLTTAHPEFVPNR